MRVEAIGTNLQTAKVMPLKNAYVSKVSNSETLKSDVFQKQGQKVAFKGEAGAAFGACGGAIVGLLLGGPVGLAAYYAGAVIGGILGHEIEENS